MRSPGLIFVVVVVVVDNDDDIYIKIQR